MNMGDSESYNFVLTDLLMVSTLTGLVGMGLGLFVSSLWKSSEAAVGSLPLILIHRLPFHLSCLQSEIWGGCLRLLRGWSSNATHLMRFEVR